MRKSSGSIDDNSFFKIENCDFFIEETLRLLGKQAMQRNV